jgi:signal-transduction protein with cAMP-binding, CBS, and nucleotidyltransferase domain
MSLEVVRSIMKNMPLLKKYADLVRKSKDSLTNNRLQDNTASTIPFFTNIPEHALAGLMEKTKILNYVKKNDLGPEYNKADSFFVIFFGSVSIFSPYDGNHNSKAATLQIQEPRLGFGKAMLLTEEVTSYFTITLEKSLYGFIPKNEFFDWMTTYPDIKFTLLGLFNED